MRVLVTVAVRPPADQPPLDELQCHGAAALLNSIIGRAVDAVGPGGERITVADSRVTAHPGGLEIGVMIDTPHRSAPAGELVADLVGQILHTTPTLSTWTLGAVTTEELPAPSNPAPSRAHRSRRPRTRPGRR